MPFQPTQGSMHVNRPLTNISIAMMQAESAFIADKVFPNIPVMKQSDRYITYDRGHFNRDEMQERAPATESAGSGYTIDNTPTYFCKVYSFHKDIPDQLRSNADEPLNLDAEATRYVSYKALLKREKIWAANYFTTSKWANDWTGVSGTPTGSQVKQWNDATATPIEDVRTWKRTILQSTGITPNVLVLGRTVFDELMDHPTVIDRIKYGQTSPGAAMASRQLLAQLFELDEVLVMDAIENTAKEGATNSHSFIGGKAGLLVHRPASPGLMTPTAGYTFSWVGYLPGQGPAGNVVKRLRNEFTEVDRIEISMSFDLKLVASDLGLFCATLVA